MSYEAAKALINKGYSRPSLYSLELSGLRDWYEGDKLMSKPSRYERDYLSMFCRSINIPGVSHDTQTALGQVSLGVQEDIPSAIKFGNKPIVAEIIDNRDLDMYKLFRSLFDRSAQSGFNSKDDRSRTQRMRYYGEGSESKYTFDFNIRKLEYPSALEKSKDSFDPDPIDYYITSMEYTYVKGYVTSLSEIQLGSNMFDTFMTFRVALNYETYSYNKERDEEGETYGDVRRRLGLKEVKRDRRRTLLA